MCELSAEGVSKSLDEHKLLPTEGTYDATINGKGVELTITAERTLQITPAIAKGEVIIEIE
jgi:hypothetical protein